MGHGLLISIFLRVFYSYSAQCLRLTVHSNSLKIPVTNVMSTVTILIKQ